MARGEQVYPLATMNPCHNGAGYYYADLHVPRHRPRLIKLGKQEPNLDNLPELYGTLTHGLKDVDKRRIGGAVIRRLCSRPIHSGVPRLNTGEPRNEWVGSFIFVRAGAHLVEDFVLGKPDENDFAIATSENPYQRLPGAVSILPLPPTEAARHPVMALVQATFDPQPGQGALYMAVTGHEQIVTSDKVGLEL